MCVLYASPFFAVASGVKLADPTMSWTKRISYDYISDDVVAWSDDVSIWPFVIITDILDGSLRHSLHVDVHG